jgi:hypothetical protein
MALTDTAIRETKPGRKPFKVYDRDGLFLLVNPGGSKLWRWPTVLIAKKSSWRSLVQAREHLRKMLATGIDPMAERKAKSKSNSRKPRRDSVSPKTTLSE